MLPSAMDDRMTVSPAHHASFVWRPLPSILQIPDTVCNESSKCGVLACHVVDSGMV